MNPIQRQLLELADTLDLGSVSYYRLAKRLGIAHPYRVKFALDQLEKDGRIIRNRQTGQITKVTESQEFSGLLSIPYYGEVNCGSPLAIADDTVAGFLRVSQSLIKTPMLNKLFALKAKGDSMNMANLAGSNVNEGDFVLIESIERHQANSGDYIVSVIQGAANLKRLFIDKAERQLVLFSESTYDQPPIIISTLDADEDDIYLPVGKAVQVIKGVSLTPL